MKTYKHAQSHFGTTCQTESSTHIYTFSYNHMHIPYSYTVYIHIYVCIYINIGPEHHLTVSQTEVMPSRNELERISAAPNT